MLSVFRGFGLMNFIMLIIRTKTAKESCVNVNKNSDLYNATYYTRRTMVFYEKQQNSSDKQTQNGETKHIFPRHQRGSFSS